MAGLILYRSNLSLSKSHYCKNNIEKKRFLHLKLSELLRKYFSLIFVKLFFFSYFKHVKY